MNHNFICEEVKLEAGETRDDLPAAHERKKMIVLFLEMYLLDPHPGARMKKVRKEGIEETEIDQVVEQTEGFSGRAISKLVFAWQAAAYGTEGAVLDRETFFRTVEDHKGSMGQKEAWLEGAKKRADQLFVGFWSIWSIWSKDNF